MGKETGFLEFERQDAAYGDVAERLAHYKEFTVPLGEAPLRQQAARCMNCGIPFCHTGCPVNNLIPDWNHLVYESDWKDALDNLHSTNNFPEFTGRVCPAPCEAACTLNIIDSPVTIKSIECAIADRGWKEGWIVPEPPKHKTGKRVAVVGSGPAGLAVARRGDLHVVERPGHALSVSLLGPARNPSSMSTSSHGDPTTGSPSTRSIARRRPRPPVTKAASASTAGRTRGSSASTSVTMPLPLRST